MRAALLSFGAMLAVGVGPLFAAQSSPAPGTGPTALVAGWEIQEAREGCTAAARYTDGTTFILSYDSFDGNGFLFFGNEGWHSVVDGQEYPFEITFTPLANYSLRGRGRPVEGLGAFAIPFTGINLITHFMEADTLVVQTGRNVVGRFRLDGSYAAAIELARCNRRALDRVRPDPFAQ